MASTERTSPLAHWAEPFRAASASPAFFSVREVPFCTQVDVRGNAADGRFAGAVREAIAVALPERANTWSGGADRAAIWLGPDQWLVVAGEGRADVLCERLAAALQGIHASVTDVSANRTQIEISGSLARLVLAKGCSLDLHGSRFGAGRSSQAALAKASVILQCLEGSAAFRVYVRNSFADYLALWLVDAAAECAASRSLDSDRLASRLG